MDELEHGSQRSSNFESGGNVVDVFPLGYDDGWFVSGGVEYAYTANTILRAGVAYEQSPIDDDIRNVSLPDNDRVWLSAGLSTKITKRLKLDFGYSHLFVEDAPISEDGDVSNLTGTEPFGSRSRGRHRHHHGGFDL